MDLELRGRRVLITGGSKGIGRACALAFAREGASLVLVARDEAELGAAADAARAAGAPEVATVAVDLSEEDGQLEVVDRCTEVDVVVNNAGAIPPGGVDAVSTEEWRRAWDLKVFGYISLCRHFQPRLAARGGGVIVNVIGAAGIRPQPSYIAGGTGNAALVALTQALGSRSLREGVRVVGVNPGLVLTDRMASLLQAAAERRFGDAARWKELVPTDPPPADPAQVADVVTFLASARASHVSGCVIPIDGGESAR